MADVTFVRKEYQERKEVSKAKVKKDTQDRIQKSILRGRYFSRTIRHEQKRNGLTRQEAIYEISLITGEDRTAIYFLIRFYRKRTKAKWKQRKHDLIFRMFRRGHTNAEIGEFVGYHPQSIQRILAEIRKNNFLTIVDGGADV